MALIDVPLTGQTLNTTRPLIRANFQTIDSAFLVDHVDYNTVGAGKHEKVTFVPNASVKTFAAGEIGLFNDTSALTTRPEIFLQRDATGVGVLYPMTGYVLSGTQGWTYLPSGILMIWGRNVINPGQQKTITYGSTAGGGITGFPGFLTQATPMVVRLRTGAQGGEFVYVDTTSSLTQLVVDTSGANTNYQFFWQAIGI